MDEFVYAGEITRGQHEGDREPNLSEKNWASNKKGFCPQNNSLELQEWLFMNFVWSVLFYRSETRTLGGDTLIRAWGIWCMVLPENVEDLWIDYVINTPDFWRKPRSPEFDKEDDIYLTRVHNETRRTHLCSTVETKSETQTRTGVHKSEYQLNREDQTVEHMKNRNN